MQMYAIADETDVLTGLRLSGVEGSFAADKKAVEQAIDEVCARSELAVLLITETCAELVPERVQGLKLSSARPLLVEIPGIRGGRKRKDAVTELIRDAIGIKI